MPQRALAVDKNSIKIKGANAQGYKVGRMLHTRHDTCDVTVNYIQQYKQPAVLISFQLAMLTHGLAITAR